MDDVAAEDFDAVHAVLVERFPQCRPAIAQAFAPKCRGVRSTDRSATGRECGVAASRMQWCLLATHCPREAAAVEACARGNVLGKALWELSEDQKRSLPCYAVTFAAFDRCMRARSEQVEAEERALAARRKEEERLAAAASAASANGNQGATTKKKCDKSCTKCKHKQQAAADAVATSVV